MRADLDFYRSLMAEMGTDRPGRPAGMFFEAIIESCYRELVRDGDTVVDGGANQGLHTWPLSDLVGPTGEVIAVEAIPTLADALSRKAKQDGRTNVRISATAIGAAAGRANFTWVRSGDAYSGLRERDMPAELRPGIEVITVPVSRLDDLLAERRRPVRFVKLDLEGGEYDALRGGVKMITRDRPFLVFENGRETSAKLYNLRRDDWFGFFSGIGYKTYDLFARPFNPENWDDQVCPWYFIGVPANGADEAFVTNRLFDRISMLKMRAELDHVLEHLKLT